jgi:hypothetical protein
MADVICMFLRLRPRHLHLLAGEHSEQELAKASAYVRRDYGHASPDVTLSRAAPAAFVDVKVQDRRHLLRCFVLLRVANADHRSEALHLHLPVRRPGKAYGSNDPDDSAWLPEATPWSGLSLRDEKQQLASSALRE